VITPGKGAEAMIARPARPLFVIDVAVPRDVDPAVARIPGVGLVDIDKMGESVDLTLEHRRAAIPRVEGIVHEHLAVFDEWYRSLASIPVISSLSKKAESIRSAEVERLIARCPGLTDRDRALISGMSLTIVSRLLHSVIVKIRDHATGPEAELRAKARLVDELFELHLEASEIEKEYWVPDAEPATAVELDLN
jgi:glutamyl-tRNA reductase